MKNRKLSSHKLLVAIGRCMHFYRYNAGFGLSDAAALLGVTERTLRAYEHAEHEMTLLTALNAALLYSVRLSKLLCYSRRRTRAAGRVIRDIKTIRKKLGYTQAGLAAELGISKCSLSKYEHRQDKMPITLFYRICEMGELSEGQLNRLAMYAVSKSM